MKCSDGQHKYTNKGYSEIPKDLDTACSALESSAEDRKEDIIAAVSRFLENTGEMISTSSADIIAKTDAENRFLKKLVFILIGLNSASLAGINAMIILLILK